MTRRPLVALLLVRVKELAREPAVLFWNFVFPILLSAVLGLVRTQMADTVDIALVDTGQAASAHGAAELMPAVSQVEGLRARVVDAATAQRLLRASQVALVIEPRPEGVEYRFDPDRGEARLARALVDDALQRAAGRRDALVTANRADVGRGGRYVDFLVPGVLALNLMNGGLWGIGFGLVSARIRRLLKTLAATPMRRRDFLLSMLLSRLVLVTLEVTTLLALARWLLGVQVLGSLALVCGIVALGALTFSAIGMLLASRTETIDTISGLINAVMLPMFVLSGVFFSTDRLPALIQPVVAWLPLTALTRALRLTMMEGAGALAVAGPLLVLAGWCVLASFLSLRWFRWT